MNKDKTRQGELLPLVQRSYDLLGDLYNHVNRFPKAHKSLLGREILAASQRMLINLIAATRRRNRLLMLEEADLQLETLRILVRLSHRLTFLSHKGYEAISKELTEIGRMLGGWIVQMPDGTIRIDRWRQGTASGITPTEPPTDGKAIGSFHTHPNIGIDPVTGKEWNPRPSGEKPGSPEGDVPWVLGDPNVRAPHYVISESTIYMINNKGKVNDVGKR